MKKLATICLLAASIILATAVQAAPPRHPSDWPAYLAMKQDLARQDSLNALRYEQELKAAQTTSPKSQRAQAPRRTAGVGHRSTFPRVPVIMVNFADWTMDPTTTRQRTDSLFNGRQWTSGLSTYDKGSVRKYFSDQSNGQYAPDFDIYGPVTLSQNYSYYGSTGAGAREMTKEACQLVNDSVDFSQYDSNNDGEVDLVFVYFAGFGENDKYYVKSNQLLPDSAITGLVWPHFSTIGSNLPTFDGKKVNAYECANELDGKSSTTTLRKQAGIGVLCHEFCHGLGLPDIYTSAQYIVGRWTIMDYGCYGGNGYSPSCMTAYERYFMGWQTPQLLTSSGSYDLHLLETTGEAYMLTPTGQLPSSPNTDTLYVIENRKKTGWDAFSSSMKGMLVWRILPWSGSYPNKAQGDASNPLDLVRADGLYTGMDPDYPTNDVGFGKRGDAFPYLNKSDSSVTDSLLLARPECAFRHITLQDDVISFDLSFPGSPATALPAAPEQEPVRKMLRNGQVLILRGNEIYDMLGRRVEQ